MNNTKWILIIYIFFPCILLAQAKASWFSFDENAGLIDNNVSAIKQTSDGALWFGTSAGITYVKDGEIKYYSVEHDNLISNSISDIFESDDGTIWIGTEIGFSRLTNSDWVSIPFDTSIINKTITCILAAKDGSLWAGTRDGLYTLQEGVWNFVDSGLEGYTDYRIKAITQTANGLIYVGSQESGYYLVDKKWKNYSGRDEQDRVKILYAAPSGGLWIGSSDGLKGHKRYAFGDQIPDLYPSFINKISEATDGSIWFSNGLDLFRLNGEQIVQWMLPETESGIHITSILGAADGALWIGSQFGAYRYQLSEWNFFTIADGLWENRPTTMEAGTDGSFWFGTNSGLNRFNKNKWIRYDTSNGLPNNSIRTLEQGYDGKLWIGTWKGLCYFINDSISLLSGYC